MAFDEVSMRILVDTLYNSKGVRTAIKDVAALQKTLDNMSKGAKTTLDPTMSQRGQTAIDTIDLLKKRAKELSDQGVQFYRKTDAKNIKNFGKDMRQGFFKPIEDVQSEVDNLIAKQNKLSSANTKLKQDLLNTGLSILFFGMQLQRLSSNIIKSAISSFQKITYGAEESGGAVGVLGVHFELLKYSLGAAIDALLQAWLPTIISVIDAVSDWIQQHGDLAAKLLLFAFALGTAGVIGGSLITFYAGIMDIITALGGFKGALAKLVGVVLFIDIVTRMGGRETTTTIGDSIKDSLEAGIIGFIFGGPAGALIGFVAALTLDFMSMYMGISTAELQTLLWNRALLFTENIINNIASKLEYISDIYDAIADGTGGKTLKEAYDKFSMKEAANQKAYDIKLADHQIDVFEAEARTQLADLANQLTGEGTDINKEGFTPWNLKPEQLELLSQAAGNLNQDLDKTFLQLQKLVEGPSSLPTFTNKLGDMNEQYKTMGTQQATTTQQVASATEDMTLSLESAQTAFNGLRATFQDATEIFMQNQAALQKSLGLKGNAIDYTTGTTVGNEVMRSMFGDYTAGLGQFKPGALTDAYNSGARGGPSSFAAKPEYRGPAAPITVVNNSHVNGTYVTSASGVVNQSQRYL